MKSENETQEKRILKFLRTGRGITPLAALHRFDCMRLASCVHNIKKKLVGTEYSIINIGETRNKKTYARYVIRKKKK